MMVKNIFYALEIGVSKIASARWCYSFFTQLFVVTVFLL